MEVNLKKLSKDQDQYKIVVLKFLKCLENTRLNMDRDDFGSDIIYKNFKEICTNN